MFSGGRQREKELGDIPERFICLLIDPTLHSDVIISEFRNVLQLLQGRKGRIKQPYKFKVPNWLNYLECYDLWRQNESLSFGDIAEKVIRF